MTNYAEPSKTGLFAYRWESANVKDLALALGRVAAKVGIEIAVTLVTGAELSLFKYLLLGSNVTEFAKLFSACKKSAKLSGQLLACALAVGFPFYSQSVSIVGFSLGCQVVKTCVKTLHQLGASEVLQNVTFLGGAVDILDKAKHKALWTQILSQSVAGPIKNVYTRKDAILLLYSVSQFDWAIGRNPMFVQ